MTCCAGWPREQNPELHDLYAESLLEPGWGGELSDEELGYVRRKLQENRMLAPLWGFRPSQTSRSERAIRRLAMWGDPENRNANRSLVRPSRSLKKANLEAQSRETS